MGITISFEECKKKKSTRKNALIRIDIGFEITVEVELRARLSVPFLSTVGHIPTIMSTALCKDLLSPKNNRCVYSMSQNMTHNDVAVLNC